MLAIGYLISFEDNVYVPANMVPALNAHRNVTDININPEKFYWDTLFDKHMRRPEARNILHLQN